MLPVLVAMILYRQVAPAPLWRSPSWRTLIPLALVWAVYLGLRIHAMVGPDTMQTTALVPANLRCLPAWTAAAMTSLFMPWRLLPYYELREFGVAEALFALGCIGLVSYGSYRLWRARRGDRAIVVGLGLLILSLIPALPILPRAGSLFSERFLYLPSAGFAILAGAVVDVVPWAGAARRSLFGAVVGFVALLTLAGTWTFLRVGDWRDGRTLFSRALVRDPDNQRLLYLLGVQQVQAGEPALARPLFERALALNPKRGDVRLALANCLRMLNDNATAARMYRELIADGVLAAEAWFNLGSIKFAAGSDGLGESEFLQALRLDRSSIETYVILGEIAFQRREIAAAVVYWERGLSLNSTSPELLNNLGVAAMSLKDYSRARHFFQRALAVDPKLETVRSNLASLPPGP
jgi:Tfp pilus assembly protein PilF